MAEAKKKAETQEDKDPKKMNLAQKFVELRRACPEIIKKKHSDAVKYKYAKIKDIYELLSPAMNEWGVDWEIVKETVTRHHENGDAKYYDCYTQNTKNGPRTIWVYEADITLRWVNVDNPEETQEITLHALGTNDSGPDKAKGSAWTYCLKYYLFEKFNIDQSEDDPDNSDHSDGTLPDAQKQSHSVVNTSGGNSTLPNNKNSTAGQQSTQKELSDAQLTRMYKKGEAAGIAKETIDHRIASKYGHTDPRKMTRAQYEETCDALDAAVTEKKEEQQNAQ